MNKSIISLLIIVSLLLFSCDPAVGTLSKEFFETSLFGVNNDEKVLELSFGIDYCYNFYKISDITKENDLVIFLRMMREKLGNNQHFNITISKDLKYDDLQVITGNSVLYDDVIKIESSSNEEYEDLKIKFLYKESFEARKEIYVNCLDNKNRKQYSPIMFKIGVLDF